MSRKSAISELVEEPFVNSIGQTINPGDTIVAITTGYSHRVSTFTGVFKGVRRSKQTGEIVGSSIEQIPYINTSFDYRDDGEQVEKRYNINARQYEPTGRRYNIVRETLYRKSALQRNRIFKI
jgi:hypothetical protein